MKEEEIRTIVVETIQNIQQLSRLGEREFAKIFYGIKESNWEPMYVREKFNKYCEEGFMRAYNRLDIRNASRILDFIVEECKEEEDVN